MANENNKNKQLVSLIDDDPTSEFEIPTVFADMAEQLDVQNEIDEKTFDADRFSGGAETGPNSVASLKSVIAQQSEAIGKLEFDVEQLLSKSMGLDREVKAREEITANLNREFRQLKQALADTRKELQDRLHEIEFLQHSLNESAESAARQAADLERLRDESAQEIEYYRNQADEQSGLAASNSQELRDLREQVSRTDKYADSLRIKLQSRPHANDDSTARHKDLELSLENALSQLEDSNDQLATAAQRNKSYEQEAEKMKDDFAEEIRQLRFELGSAQETITSQGSMNEQMASDLIDNQGFRQALESQLGEIELRGEEASKKLTLRLRKTQKEADDLERKMLAKDKAIAALMSELAGSSETKPVEEDENKPMRKIDGYQSTRHERHNQQKRSRVARMLIGNTDGRELRFPLFKDRLTIGRTANNDIQLNVRYISRRHAVIVSDDGQTRLVDWGSKNGVYVNQKRIAERFLQSGDVVTIGTTKFRYEERQKR